MEFEEKINGLLNKMADKSKGKDSGSQMTVS